MSTDLPDVHFAFDVDGDRQAIVEASEFDMTGWTLEVQEDGGIDTSGFSRRDLPKTSDGSFSFIFDGDWMPVWVADAPWGSDSMALVDPQGTRHELHGFIRS